MPAPPVLENVPAYVRPYPSTLPHLTVFINVRLSRKDRLGHGSDATRRRCILSCFVAPRYFWALFAVAQNVKTTICLLTIVGGTEGRGAKRRQVRNVDECKYRLGRIPFIERYTNMS